MKVKDRGAPWPYGQTNPLGLIEPFPQDSWSSGAWLYPVKRMIRGLGGETISTYSQTFNGYDVSVSLLNLAELALWDEPNAGLRRWTVAMEVGTR
uniref:Beta-lactamase domain-containing protein n=1 Tax=Heterorhabditis bacteriophora TaxID=37862 RepID=A0A1I7WKQ0_HETBA